MVAELKSAKTAAGGSLETRADILFSSDVNWQSHSHRTLKEPFEPLLTENRFLTVL